MVIALTEDVIAFWGLRDMIVASVSALTFSVTTITATPNLFEWLFYSHSYTVSCPNNCGGHGECLNDGICDCENGYTGTDCSTGNTIH